MKLRERKPRESQNNSSSPTSNGRPSKNGYKSRKKNDVPKKSPKTTIENKPVTTKKQSKKTLSTNSSPKSVKSSPNTSSKSSRPSRSKNNENVINTTSAINPLKKSCSTSPKKTEAPKLTSVSSDNLVKKSSSKIQSNKKTQNLSSKPAENLSKKTLKRFNSDISDDLPTFRKVASNKRPKQTEEFKKYGVIVPSIDEIIADQKHLSSYKIQVEEAQTLKEPTFKMPNSPKKGKEDEAYLDCKHLTLEDISEQFKTNILFLSNIMKGQTPSDRHRRYYDKKNHINKFTEKDLTYSTSTIVFTFEQLDHMITLMQEEFDPEGDRTCYFFKVLLPELCLKIFMDIHDMNKREANGYLNNRPV